MRWSLAAQLRLGFAAALLLALGVGLAAWWIALNYKAEITSAYETQLDTTVQLAEAQAAFWQLRFGVRQFMIDGPEGQRRILEQQGKWYGIIEERLVAYEKTASSSEERRTLTSLRAAYFRYKNALPKFFELWQAGDRDGAVAWLALAIAPFGEQAERAFETQIALQRSFVEQDRLASERRARLALVVVAGITLALLAMLVAGYAYAVRMLRPIRALREQADRTVREQLGETVAASHGSNEVRALVESFQLMSDRLLARTASLRESEARYRRFVERSPDPMLAHSHGRIFLANDAMGQLLGAAPEKLIGTAMLDCIAPEHREFAKARMARTMQGLPVPHADRQLLRMDGSTVPVELAVAPISYQGEPAALVTARDITQRLRMEEAIRQSRDRLDFLLRSTPAVIWASRAEGDYARTFVSENLREILGYAPEEFIADPRFWSNHIHPEDRPAVLAGLPREIEANEFVHEYRFRHADGTWRWMRGDASVVRDATGRPEQIVGYWIDVTERVLAEEERKRAKARLEVALEAGRLAVWDADTASRRVWLSEQWAELLGEAKRETETSLEELLARTHPDDRQPLRKAVISALKGERAEYIKDNRVRAASGEWRWIQWRGRVTERTADGRAARLSGTALDITERKRLEREVELASRMKSEFMASVTHELRTPLSSVIGFAELLKEEVAGPLNPRQAQFAGDIFESGRQLLALVEGILEMSRLDVTGAALEREPTEISPALEQRMASHQKAAEARGVTLQTDVAADAGRVDVNPKALHRMLDALLDNAIKFNRDGGTVAVSAARRDGCLEIAVADSGAGIAREDLPKLFKPLVQLDAGLARRHGGIGLGLALARRLAELHGGTIEVESAPGKGSTFTLRLPVPASA